MRMHIIYIIRYNVAYLRKYGETFDVTIIMYQSL